jgi:hypothetical protein
LGHKNTILKVSANVFLEQKVPPPPHALSPTPFLVCFLRNTINLKNKYFRYVLIAPQQPSLPPKQEFLGKVIFVNLRRKNFFCFCVENFNGPLLKSIA